MTDELELVLGADEEEELLEEENALLRRGTAYVPGVPGAAEETQTGAHTAAEQVFRQLQVVGSASGAAEKSGGGRENGRSFAQLELERLGRAVSRARRLEPGQGSVSVQKNAAQRVSLSENGADRWKTVGTVGGQRNWAALADAAFERDARRYDGPLRLL